MGLVLPQRIITKWSGSNKEHYINMGYEYNGCRKELEIDVLDLPPKSQILVKSICDYCGNEFERGWVSILKILNSNSPKIACDSCFKIKASDVKKEIILRDNKINPLYWNKDWLYEQYVKNNRTLLDISNECNVDINRIMIYVRKYKLHKSPDYNELRKSITYDILYDLYVIKCYSLKEISDMYGVSIDFIMSLRDELGIPKRLNSNYTKRYYSDIENRNRCSEHSKAIWKNNKSRTKLLKARKNTSKETRIKRSASMQGIDVDNWDGFITPLNKRLRISSEYKEWRTKVFIRDNYTCQCCGERDEAN